MDDAEQGDRRHDDPVAYDVREVVAEFHDATLFENAVETVERSGIDRAAIHMIASHDAVREKLHRLYRPISEVEDDASVPQTIFADRHEVAESRAAAIGLPVYIGGAGAGLAVVASGGALAFAAAVAAAGATAGAGIGALISRSISRHHAKELEAQLAMGALLLWVEVADGEEEAAVTALLRQAGGEKVRAHTLTRFWGPDDVPLHDFEPDPFLERDSQWG